MILLISQARFNAVNKHQYTYVLVISLSMLKLGLEVAIADVDDDCITSSQSILNQSSQGS